MPELPHSSGLRVNLIGKRSKVSIVLDARAFVGVVVPNGAPRFSILVAVAGKTLKAKLDLNAKSARKCCATIAEHGPEGVSVLLQGKLVGDVIEEAGIAAAPKTPKPGAINPPETAGQPAGVPAAAVDPAEIRQRLGLPNG